MTLWLSLMLQVHGVLSIQVRSLGVTPHSACHCCYGCRCRLSQDSQAPTNRELPKLPFPPAAAALQDSTHFEGCCHVAYTGRLFAQ